MKKTKIGKGYYQSGYGRGFKSICTVWAINGKAYVKDANSLPFQTDLEGYTMVNRVTIEGNVSFHAVSLINEHLPLCN